MNESGMRGEGSAPEADASGTSVWTSRGALVALAAVIVLVVGAGVGGYEVGRNSGPDLPSARRSGAQAGYFDGKAAGTRTGTTDGLSVGRKRAMRPAYREAYKAAYAKALKGR